MEDSRSTPEEQQYATVTRRGNVTKQTETRDNLGRSQLREEGVVSCTPGSILKTKKSAEPYFTDDGELRCKLIIDVEKGQGGRVSFVEPNARLEPKLACVGQSSVDDTSDRTDSVPLEEPSKRTSTTLDDTSEKTDTTLNNTDQETSTGSGSIRIQAVPVAKEPAHPVPPPSPQVFLRAPGISETLLRADSPEPLQIPIVHAQVKQAEPVGPRPIIVTGHSGAVTWKSDIEAKNKPPSIFSNQTSNKADTLPKVQCNGGYGFRDDSRDGFSEQHTSPGGVMATQPLLVPDSPPLYKPNTNQEDTVKICGPVRVPSPEHHSQPYNDVWSLSSGHWAADTLPRAQTSGSLRDGSKHRSSSRGVLVTEPLLIPDSVQSHNTTLTRQPKVVRYDEQTNKSYHTKLRQSKRVEQLPPAVRMERALFRSWPRHAPPGVGGTPLDSHYRPSDRRGARKTGVWGTGDGAHEFNVGTGDYVRFRMDNALRPKTPVKFPFGW